MIFTATTAIEAEEIAAELRRIHDDTDWTVHIERPLFDGDHFRVVVE